MSGASCKTTQASSFHHACDRGDGFDPGAADGRAAFAGARAIGLGRARCAGRRLSADRSPRRALHLLEGRHPHGGFGRQSTSRSRQLLRHASILDQFHRAYPRGRLASPPTVNDDPGRFRDEAFFNKMYGDCRKGQVPHMVPITWLPKTWGKRIYVTSVNGVARKLQAVSAEIDGLPANIKRAAYPIAGIYSCRPSPTPASRACTATAPPSTSTP